MSVLSAEFIIWGERRNSFNNKTALPEGRAVLFRVESGGIFYNPRVVVAVKVEVTVLFPLPSLDSIAK